MQINSTWIKNWGKKSQNSVVCSFLFHGIKSLPISFCSHCTRHSQHFLEKNGIHKECFVLSKKALYILIYGKKTKLWVEASRNIYFLSIRNMTYSNNVQSVDFLASDFQLVSISYTYYCWNFKPNLLGNENKEKDFFSCNTTCFTVLILP